MSHLFIGWNIFSIIGLVILIFLSARKKDETAKIVATLYISLALSIVSNLAQYFIHDESAALMTAGFYYMLDLCIFFVFFRYILVFTKSLAKSKKAAFNNYLFFSLATIDFITLIINSKCGLIFEGTSRIMHSLVFWKYTYHKYFIFHFVLSSIIMLQCLVSLITRAIKVPRFFRLKMLLLTSLMFMIALAKELMRENDFMHNYSICLYIFFGIFIFSTSFYGLNRILVSAMLSLVSEKISDAIVFFDEKERCFYLNQRAREIFGDGKTNHVNAEGYKNKLMHQHGQAMYNYLKLQQHFTINEKEHTYECEYKIIRDKKQRPVVSYLKLEDITDELERIAREKYRMEHDPLTGLYNRAAFFQYAAEILHNNPDEKFLLVATNILDFKVVNNLFGKEVGDELIKFYAKRISTVIYQNEICGRISGDKFAILIPKNDFNIEEILKNNSLLQQAVNKYNYRVNNCVGVYEVANHFENIKTMFDKALLAIQKLRGNPEQEVAFYDMPLMDRMLREKKIIAEFEGALANNEFIMYLHPQVKAEDSAVPGAEALVRWLSPDKGLIPPMEFIPLLEQYGLIHKLDQFVWELAVKKLAEWKELGNDMYISINISPKDFFYCDVYTYLTELVEKYNVKPQKLNIEITETVFMQNVDVHRNILQKLRNYGFIIEMDDFGSGYSSLNTLKNLEMNILKIDMNFLKDWDKNKKNRKIISSIIKMAKSLGMTVVSEGVETEDQANFLREAGCDIFQGYFFSKPVPPEEFEERYVTGDKNE